jgi:hypothetical protein
MQGGGGACCGALWPDVWSTPLTEPHPDSGRRAVSAFWGFADDVFLWVEMREGRKEDKSRSSLVYILGQAQLRIGSVSTRAAPPQPR